MNFSVSIRITAIVTAYHTAFVLHFQKEIVCQSLLVKELFIFKLKHGLVLVLCSSRWRKDLWSLCHCVFRSICLNVFNYDSVIKICLLELTSW